MYYLIVKKIKNSYTEKLILDIDEQDKFRTEME